MKKLAMMFALIGIAGIASAQDAAPVTPAKDTKAVAPAQATKVEATAKAEAAKTHEVEAEIVSYDAAKKTLTIKGTPDNKTVPVEAKAVASVKNLKAGEKVTLLCHDNDKGEHEGVAGVKPAAKK